MMRPSERPPHLQPPPRVPAAGTPRHDFNPGELNDRHRLGRRLGIALFLAALTVGLLLVFVALPRWTKQRLESPLTISTPGVSSDHSQPPQPEATVSTAIEALAPEATEPEQRPQIISSPAAPPALTTSAAGPSPEERDFVRVMSEGLDALEREEWDIALEAFERASHMRPGSPETKDGLARANAGLRRQKLENGRKLAAALEQAEAWRQACDAYAEVLKLDPTAHFAQEGHTRASARAELDERLEFHLKNEDRLSSLAVLESASSLLEETQAIMPRGSRLEDQLVRLEKIIAVAAKPVPVVLESDNLTEVTIHRVGRQGNFLNRQLYLRPGVYTVVGSRQGYRDIRLRLEVRPGTPEEPLMVRCSETP